MQRSWLPGVVTLTVTLCVMVPSALAGRIPNLRVEAVSGWSVEPPPPHDNLVEAYRHRTGVRAFIGLEWLRAGATAQTFAAANRQALERLHFRVKSSKARTVGAWPAVELRLESPDRKTAQIQVYLVSGSRGFVITLTTRPDQLERSQPAFEEFLAAIRFP